MTSPTTLGALRAGRTPAAAAVISALVLLLPTPPASAQASGQPPDRICAEASEFLGRLPFGEVFEAVCSDEKFGCRALEPDFGRFNRFAVSAGIASGTEVILDFSFNGRLYRAEVELTAAAADENLPALLRGVMRELPAATGPAYELPSPDGRTLRHVEADREAVVERRDDLLRISVTDYSVLDDLLNRLAADDRLLLNCPTSGLTPLPSIRLGVSSMRTPAFKQLSCRVHRTPEDVRTCIDYSGLNTVSARLTLHARFGVLTAVDAHYPPVPMPLEDVLDGINPDLAPLPEHGAYAVRGDPRLGVVRADYGPDGSLFVEVEAPEVLTRLFEHKERFDGAPILLDKARRHEEAGRRLREVTGRFYTELRGPVGAPDQSPQPPVR